jgi:3-oxoacyl-[acyl-carrier-protein] synthase II
MTAGVVITHWSAFSPYGAGRRAFAAGFAARRTALGSVDHDRWDTRDERAALVPGFDVRQVLGKKGTRAMNRVSGLAVATMGLLQEETAAGQASGLVLGTTTGSAETKMGTVRGALRAARPYLIDPGAAPYVVMNGAAGQCAIWHGFKGPNATIAAGRPSGLAALGYARRLLLTGRAPLVVAGAAEEYSRARSWLEFHAAGEDPAALPLGEGCAMFAVAARSSASRPALADVLALDFRICVDGDWRTAVDRSVRHALLAAERSASDVWATCASGAAGAAGTAEAAVLKQQAGGATALPAVTGLLGETHAASSAFQVAAVLSEAARSPGAAGRVAVITSTDPPSGMVAVCVLGFAALTSPRLSRPRTSSCSP